MFLTGVNISSPSVSAESGEVEKIIKEEEKNNISKANFKGVDPKKIDGLKEKMKKGEKLDSDIFMENQAKKVGKEEVMATSENPYIRKDFPDGSFIESSVVDVTEELAGEQEDSFSIQKVEQVGGTSEYRTLSVKHTSPWGYQAFRVKVYFPLIGYSKILQAYDWYYIGNVKSVDYRGIYRASETASADAVAIQRLQVGLGIGSLSGIVKLEFRMRDGRYWSVYAS